MRESCINELLILTIYSSFFSHIYIYIYVCVCVCVCVFVCVCVTLCWALISMGVGKCQSEDSFVLAWNPHKGLAREISHETGRGRGKEGPRVKRSRQKRLGQRTDQSTEENRAASRREQELGLWTQARLAILRRWVSVPSGFVGISLEYTLERKYRKPGKSHRPLPSCT